MNTLVKTTCPLCKASIETPYYLLGSSVSCRACGRLVIPAVREGVVYTDTGHEIRFSDFLQLLSHRAYRMAIACLLSEWYGYSISIEEGLPVVRAQNGDSVDVLGLHHRIQNDPEKQIEMYRTAMGLWR